MKKSLVVLGILAALAAPQVAGAEGFAINEWSTEGVAMGGARLFAEDDPANMAYNPASMTKIKGDAMKVTATYISPHGKYNLYNASGREIEANSNKKHAAWAPGMYYVKQLNEKDWIGMGTFSRFAMISEFERSSLASSSGFFSKLNGLSFDVEYAHKFDKKWSAAVGAEVNYVGLELQNNLGGVYPMQTKGDSYAMGWNAAANYTFDDKNEMGVVYRSRVKHSLEADTSVFFPNMTNKVNAYGCVTLPDSWAIGYNHKFNDKTRVELNATRTNWSTYDALNIFFDKSIIPGGNVTAAPSPKNWEDGWRYAIGVEHKLSDKYTIMAGFSYDQGSIPYDGGDFLVPTGNRKTYSIGGRFNDDKQAIAIALGFMDIGDLTFKGSSTYAQAHTHDNYAKVFSIGYERHF